MSRTQHHLHNINIGADTPQQQREQEQEQHRPAMVQNVAIRREADEDRFSNNRDARPEERWHRSIEQTAREFRDHAAQAQEMHDRSGYSARMKHLFLSLPGIITALSVSAIASLWRDEDSAYLIVPLSLIGATLTSVHTALNLGGRSELFWRYSALYGGVVAEVDTELSRDVDWRTPPDAFMAKLRADMGHLNGSAPQLPGKGCCGCSKYEGTKPLPKPTRTGNVYYEAEP